MGAVADNFLFSLQDVADVVEGARGSFLPGNPLLGGKFVHLFRPGESTLEGGFELGKVNVLICDNTDTLRDCSWNDGYAATQAMGMRPPSNTQQGGEELELRALYNNRSAIGGFLNDVYWGSPYGESTPPYADIEILDFATGNSSTPYVNADGPPYYNMRGVKIVDLKTATPTSLSECFQYARYAGFDQLYYGNETDLTEFRNYKHPYRMDLWSVRVGDIDGDEWDGQETIGIIADPNPYFIGDNVNVYYTASGTSTWFLNYWVWRYLDGNWSDPISADDFTITNIQGMDIEVRLVVN